MALKTVRFAIQVSVDLFTSNTHSLQWSSYNYHIDCHGPAAMLKPPNRPRVPSAATLRVLYQLAYISSGTAVGIGALCAEERRRRTQIVQRVADNAKRIRQSPRYAHNAAAVAVREHESEEEFPWRASDNGLEAHRLEGESTSDLKPRHWEGAKMPELPSVVEEEYGLLAARAEKKKGRKRRRIGRSGRPEFVEEHRSREPVAKRELDRRKEQQDQTSAKALSKQPGLRKKRNITSGTSSALPEKLPWEWISYRRPYPKRPNKGDLLPQAAKRVLFHASEEGKAYRQPKQTIEQVAEPFLTRHLWETSDIPDTESLDGALSKDVDMFFEKVDVKCEPKLEMQYACRIANGLLHLCYKYRSVSDMRSLQRWKIVMNEFSTEDLRKTVDMFPEVVRRFTPGCAVGFISDLLSTEAYLSLPPPERLELDLRVCAEALKMIERPTQPEPLDMEAGRSPYGRLTSGISIPSEVKGKDKKWCRILGSECRRLVREGHFSPAVNLWCTAMEAQGFYRRADWKLDKELFYAALEARRFSLCARMLRFKQSRDFNYQLRTQKDDFIRVCFEEGGTGLLRSLFDWKSPDALAHNKLSPHSYICLTQSFAEKSSGFETFRAYHEKVHPKMRASVTESSIATKAFSLKANWNATRNFESVQSDYKVALQQFSQSGADTIALQPMLMAMIEIQLSANRLVPAMSALTTLNELDTEGNVATLTALALAKQKDWTALERLLDVVEHNPTMIKWTGTTTRAFNNMLHLFSKAHSAHELSDLVKKAINTLQFRPNKSTWEIMLSSFVSKRARSLLEHWLRYPKTIGSHLKLDANLAATLMTRWAMDVRQPHHRVIFFCRYLTQVPSLRSGHLLQLAGRR